MERAHTVRASNITSGTRQLAEGTDSTQQAAEGSAWQSNLPHRAGCGLDPYPDDAQRRSTDVGIACHSWQERESRRGTVLQPQRGAQQRKVARGGLVPTGR